MPDTTPPVRPRDPGPALAGVKMHLCMPDAPTFGTVVSTERCTRGKTAGFVRHIALDVSGTPLAGSFRPGQSFGVIPEGVDAHGRPHKVRLYSISSPTRGEDGSGCVVATTVKRTIDEHHETHRLFLGVASNYLCDLQPGARVMLTGPSGKRFVLPADPGRHDYLFFATGTGIAPYRGMILDMLEAGVESRIVLVAGAAHSNDLLYHDLLAELAARHPNFHYLTAVSRERQADGEPPMYVQGRLATHRSQIMPVLESERALVYVCGVAGMELGVMQALARELPGPTLERFVTVDPAIRDDVQGWTRSMIPRQIGPTRRMFVEVY
jgi:ferredoxin--NADP+ reductase